ncbi:NAD(P)-binding protein [Viridibacillus sp. NPDC096237]|uniref:NAD(P)-binding protein n=1 Tax=Viridibacillus sp. NPDC096237 TaxID=3390721 RepID=UPI003CFD5E0D
MKIVIIDGGISGLYAAIALQKRQLDAEVFEATPSFQPVGAGIGICSNAMQALMKMALVKRSIEMGRL